MGTALLCKADLHSAPVLYGDVLVWRLYPNAYVQVLWEGDAASIEIISNSISAGTVMHLRTCSADLAAQLYALGKKGNLLVLKQSLLGTSIFYLGPSEGCPPSGRSPVYFGKRKYDGGRLIYFEQI